MESLALKLREQSQSFVFFTDLSSLSDFLADQKPTTQENNVLKTVLYYMSNSELSSYLLCNHAGTNGQRIVLVLDGFDEINQANIHIAKSALATLPNEDKVQIIMSSRPNMRETTETTFNLISYDNLPFGREEQANHIGRQWLKLSPQAPLQTLENFADDCILSVKCIPRDERNAFLEIPLQCHLLAIIYEQQAKLLSDPKHIDLSQVPEIATMESVFDLHECFVDTLVHKVACTNPIAKTLLVTS